MDTPENCIDAINTFTRAIGNAHKDVLLYSALQGELLLKIKDIYSPSFASILKNNIDLSRSHAYFLMKFNTLVVEYPKLLQCELPLNFFNKNFTTIKKICDEDDVYWKN